MEADDVTRIMLKSVRPIAFDVRYAVAYVQDTLYTVRTGTVSLTGSVEAAIEGSRVVMVGQ